MGDRIFISYRRADTEGYAGRLEDALGQFFGRRRVVRDIGSIDPGQDFRQKSEEMAAGASALIVLIGPRWLEPASGGVPRLHEPGDLVAAEIRAGLAGGQAIVPVLVQGAVMPREDELPEALRPLARRNAVSVSDAQWPADTARLAKVLAIDVRSGLERQVDWLRRVVILLLIVPFIVSLVMLADPQFRAKAMRTEADGLTFVFKLTPRSLDRLDAPLREAVRAHAASLASVAGTRSRDQLAAPLEQITGMNADQLAAVLHCCTWTVMEQKKNDTQALATLGAICIVLASLLLGWTRSWIAPERRRYVWVSIAVGCGGVTAAFFYYLRNVEDSPFIWPSDEYFGLVVTCLLIGTMLALLAFSGFKPNDGMR